MNIERDKFLTEQLGKCWHEYIPHPDYDSGIWICTACGDEPNIKQKRSNFTTWVDFGELCCHLNKKCGNSVLNIVQDCLPMDEAFPDRFADTVYEFLKEQDNVRKIVGMAEPGTTGRDSKAEKPT